MIKALYWLGILILGSSIIGMTFPSGPAFFAAFFWGMIVGNVAARDLLGG